MTRDKSRVAVGLLPCPFCGRAAGYGEIEDSASPDFGGHYIVCTDGMCGASTNLRFAGGDDPKPLLAGQWNRRTRADASDCERALAWCVENDHECLGDHPARLAAALLLLHEPRRDDSTARMEREVAREAIAVIEMMSLKIKPSASEARRIDVALFYLRSTEAKP